MSEDPHWLFEPPTEPGHYQFFCHETGYSNTKVIDRNGTMYASMDGLWNPAKMWHDGLTDPAWRKLN